MERVLEDLNGFFKVNVNWVKFNNYKFEALKVIKALKRAFITLEY